MSLQPFRLGILGSGKGSNYAAIAESIVVGQVPAEVALVVSDVSGAGILEQAAKFGHTHRHIPPGKFRTKLDDEADEKYLQAFQEAAVDLIVLAGFMRILKGNFLRAFSLRVVNIHPSLLPAFPGLEAWKQALDYGVKWTGCTVHFVDQGVDSGPIIAQDTVPVRESDDVASLHARIQQTEHRLYPKAIRALAEGRVVMKGRQAFWI